jgi:hypothetical protein
MTEDTTNPEAAKRGAVLKRYAIALVVRAIDLPYLNNDDVPEEFQPGDGVTVGAAFRMLLNAQVIRPYRETIESAGIYGGFRRSTRPENNGHRNPLYTLVNRTVAQEWLRSHGVDLAAYKQEALAL